MCLIYKKLHCLQLLLKSLRWFVLARQMLWECGHTDICGVTQLPSLAKQGQIITPSYVIHSVMWPHLGVVMSCCDLGMTRRYSEENFPTLLANNGQGINLTIVVTRQYKGCLACFPPGLVLLEQLSKRVCFVGVFLQIKLCQTCMCYKDILGFIQLQFDKSLWHCWQQCWAEPFLRKFTVCMSVKGAAPNNGSIHKNVLFLILAWSSFKDKKKGFELHVPWSSESCWGFCSSYIGRCDSLITWSCSCMCLTSLDIWSPSTPRRSQHFINVAILITEDWCSVVCHWLFIFE